MRTILTLMPLFALAACSGPTFPGGDVSTAYAIMWAGKAIAGAILTGAVIRAIFNK